MKKLIPSNEQSNIILAALSGRDLAISAGAGCAKTATCVMIAEEIEKSSLYVSYNKSIATEASSKFPSWVQCSTMHSLAWQSIVRGSRYKKKLKGYLDQSEILAINNITGMSPDKRSLLINAVISNIEGFCGSGSLQLRKFLSDRSEQEPVLYVTETIKYWFSMIDTMSDTSITHDTYLKLFQLNQPQLGFEVIYMDECQDANPVIADIIMRQERQIIMVGDANQAIYGWRGSLNIFNNLPLKFHKMQLTSSYRFNSKVANASNKLISILNPGNPDIEGLYTGTTVNSRAFLVRTNIDLFERLIEYEQSKTFVYVIGGLKELFTQLSSASNLRADGDPSKRYNKQIASYKSWDDLLESVENFPELKKVVGILTRFPNIYATILLIKTILVDLEGDANVTMATVHKAKGLEWDSVYLGEGFLPRGFDELGSEEKLEALEKDQTGNLIYVGMTRARIRLGLPQDIQNLLGM